VVCLSRGTKHAATSAATPDQVPLIHADGDPVKVKPDRAGGMDIPDKDNPIYSIKPGASPTEHILPPPEAPSPRPTAPLVQSATAPQPPAQPAPMLTPQQVAALAKPAAKPAEPPAKAAATDGMRIQLASLRTPDAARDEWARLKHENADLLGKLTAVAVRADLGERGIYYRVEAGPVGDKAAAVRLCKALKERDLECQLVQ
jgi:cell division septation protein DedD